MALAANSSHAASAASGERHVALWEVPPAKRSKKQHPATTTVSLEDPAVQLDMAAVSTAAPAESNGNGNGADSGGRFHLAAVSEAGEVYVWACQAGTSGEGSGGVEAQLLLRARVGDGASRG